MPEQKLEVRMLGGFSVMYAGKEIVIDRSFVSKTTQLFQLFLTHAQDGVSKATLIDALYEYNAPLWKKAGYNPPPKPGSLKKTVYAQADTEKTK